MMLAHLDPDEFRARAARGLRREPPGLEGEEMRPIPAAPLRPAAVLVPIVMHAEEATVLLTQRASHLRDHSGQIAFPGGKIDADETPLATALREAEEEIGLDRRHVRPIGYLDPYLSSTGYRILPVVADIEPPFALSLNCAEVADAFEVPLAFLMDPSNHELHVREWKGRIREYDAVPFRERYIWGVTAGILRNLHARLYEA
jgi:8-oxo-dGTP pyrophosphatase MutT (NUDIX family)